MYDDASPTERKLAILLANSYEEASEILRDGINTHHQRIIWHTSGSGKTNTMVVLARSFWQTLEATAHSPAHETAQSRLLAAGERLRSAVTNSDRRAAARIFLAALADLISLVLYFLIGTLLLLLSRAVSRTDGNELPPWKPEPIDVFPQIKPRGPNATFPVLTYRGGHYRSTLGSVVLAA
ncbi:hypothetical protein ACFV97_24420 [Streptomyces sp. NPDC059913]|uniref:hypothetical protein n=1 Tax=unclassified Streptomyces TaxID=2593676 RepID=UPI003664210F